MCSSDIREHWRTLRRHEGAMMMRVVEGIEIRPAHVERDAALIRSLDTSFETGAILDVQADGRGFRLVEKTIEPPLSKAFDLGRLDAAHEWERVWLALDGDQAVGVIATQHEMWNLRVIIWHLYVNTSHRRRGIGKRLLNTALSAAREAGARTAWLETTNLNLPGMQAYERLGFQLCGLDTSLYDATASEGEVALFLCRSLIVE
jgi:ribosomal protein S18 acetylase RimI-like enzyme